MIQDLIIAATRRGFLCKHVPPCPKCGEVHQIQLVEWIHGLAKWKCRTCKYAWLFEPSALKTGTPDVNDWCEIAIDADVSAVLDLSL